MKPIEKSMEIWRHSRLEPSPYPNRMFRSGFLSRMLRLYHPTKSFHASPCCASHWRPLSVRRYFCKWLLGLSDQLYIVLLIHVHNCAKHIVDAGITRVVYFEPYQKSLAIKLHSDTINDSSEKQSQNKVDFVAYGGVAPSRYEDFFRITRERKNDKTGEYIDYGKERQELIPLNPPLIEDPFNNAEKDF